jgi:hypothetical protein
MKTKISPSFLLKKPKKHCGRKNTDDKAMRGMDYFVSIKNHTFENQHYFLKS